MKCLHLIYSVPISLWSGNILMTEVTPCSPVPPKILELSPLNKQTKINFYFKILILEISPVKWCHLSHFLVWWLSFIFLISPLEDLSHFIKWSNFCDYMKRGKLVIGFTETIWSKYKSPPQVFAWRSLLISFLGVMITKLSSTVWDDESSGYFKPLTYLKSPKVMRSPNYATIRNL